MHRARHISRRGFLASAAAPLAAAPDKNVILTFDDAVKSHLTFVAPLLRDLGFHATFFISHRWMPDEARFLTWQDVAAIHAMGFEIGNHTWTHDNFSTPRNASRLAGELALVENELARVKVPKPVSFAWPGNGFGPEAYDILDKAGYRFARRGISPEQPYGKLNVGPAYEPDRYDRLLIPTTGDAYPDWTFEHFLKVIAEARSGRIVVLQFHGVPDEAHPWVHTPPAMFRRYMEHLKTEGFRTLAMRDLTDVARSVPADPMRARRFPEPANGRTALPVEVETNRRDQAYWSANMRRHHFTSAELQQAFAGSPPAPAEPANGAILPYPGTRHPRAGFLEGAIDPLRGTKFSFFLPDGGYAVIDVPEAIFSNLGLIFLGHTHVPTIWNRDNIVIPNVDWTRRSDGSLESQWKLPNGIEFGATAAYRDGVDMTLWLHNGTKENLTGLRTQICVMLKEASGYSALTGDNKRFDKRTASVEQEHSGRRLITEWERCGRTWGNPKCPCMHSDPVLPDCPQDARVEVKGRIWIAKA